MERIVLSVAITFHTEGKIAKETIDSVISALKPCEFSYEIIAHIDNGDDTTKKTVKNALSDFPAARIIEAKFGNPSDSRNNCTKAANGTYIAFVDGDDIVSENWFNEAYKTLQRFPDAIIHPQYNVTFGDNDRNRVWKMHNSFSDEKDALILAGYNRWDAACMLSTKIAKKHPYMSYAPGFGYEDWHFNADTRTAGIKHMVAKDTISYYRISTNNSVFKQSQAEKHTIAKIKSIQSNNIRAHKALGLQLFGTRIRNKLFFVAKKTKVGRAINNSIGKNRISKSAKIQIMASGLMNGPIIYADSFSSERTLLGKYFYTLLPRKNGQRLTFDEPMSNYQLVNFAKITKGLTGEEKELLLTQLIVQSDTKDIVFPKSDYYRNWVNTHRQLIDTLNIKVSEQL